MEGASTIARGSGGVKGILQIVPIKQVRQVPNPFPPRALNGSNIALNNLLLAGR